MAINIKHYTYTVSWSAEDQEHVGVCAELPSLSWLASDPAQALAGIMQAVSQAVQDMQRDGEDVPLPIADRTLSQKHL